MAQILVRNLEEDVKAKLRRRAHRHGCSMEEEVRDILRNAVRNMGRPRATLGARIARRFAGVGLDTDVTELRGEARPAVLTK